jgi:hypothetical protein
VLRRGDAAQQPRRLLRRATARIFVRDFKAVVGVTPAAYARSIIAPRPG